MTIGYCKSSFSIFHVRYDRLSTRMLMTPSSSSSSSQQPSLLFGLGGFLLSWYSRRLDRYPIVTKSITSGLISGTGDLICQLLQRQQHYRSQKLSVDDGVDTDARHFDRRLLCETTNIPELDMQRTSRFVILGMFLVGPLCHYWYNSLAKTIVPGLSTSFRIVSKRVIVDQFMFAPLFVLVWTKSFQFIQSLQTQQQNTPRLLKHREINNKTNHATVDSLSITTISSSEDEQQQNSVIQLMIDKYILHPCGLSYDQYVEILIVNWMLWIPTQTLNFRFIPLRYQVLFSNLVAVTWNVYLSYVTSSKPSIKNNSYDDDKI